MKAVPCFCVSNPQIAEGGWRIKPYGLKEFTEKNVEEVSVSQFNIPTCGFFQIYFCEAGTLESSSIPCLQISDLNFT